MFDCAGGLFLVLAFLFLRLGSLRLRLTGRFGSRLSGLALTRLALWLTGLTLRTRGAGRLPRRAHKVVALSGLSRLPRRALRTVLLAKLTRLSASLRAVLLAKLT